MLIDFAPDGMVQFTRNPSLLSLFPDDRKVIERMSEIVFDNDYQVFYILFMTGEYLRRALGDEIPLYADFAEEHSPGLLTDTGMKIVEHICTFPTYEDAVKVEVAFIDFMREQGIPVV